MGSSSARKARRAGARSAPADVVSLAEAREAHARILADVAGLHPERGQRTPRPSIARWDRGRFIELSLDRLTNILRRAEDGDVEELADLWLRMLKTDAHLHSVWESRMSPIYSARWEVIPAEATGAQYELAKRGALGVNEAMRQVNDLASTLSALLNARGVGYAVAEIIWARGLIFGVPAWVPALRPIHARRFRYSDDFEIGLYDDGRACGALRKAGWPVEELSSRGMKIAQLPAGKYVVHQPIGIHDYPTATGLVHSVARWWWVKQVVTKYWLAGAEMGANPRLIGKITQQAVSTTRDEFHDDLEALSADGVIVLNDGVELDIHEGKAQASSEVWDTLLKRMNAEMSKDVFGSTLNVEIDSSGGNRAASESQADVTIRPRQQQDAAQMWSTIRRDLFAWIIRYNPHLFPPDTPIPTGRTVLVEETAGIDQLAVDSGAVRVDELRSSRGLPLIGGPDGQRFIAPITRSPAAATTSAIVSPQTSSLIPPSPGQS